MKKQSCQRAFTLVEVLLVVALIGLIVVSAGSFWTSLSASRGQTAVRLVQSQLDYARDHADLTNTTHYFIFDPATNVCGIYTRGDAGFVAIQEPFSKDALLVDFSGKQDATTGVAVVAIDVGGHSLLGFDLHGVPVGTDAHGAGATVLRSAATIELQVGENKHLITVNPITGTVVSDN